MVETIELCRLCETPIKAHGYKNADEAFCCVGCHTVHQILSSQNALDKFREHPLFHRALHSGLISNPDLIEQVRQKKEETLEGDSVKLHLEIQDMWCPSCAEIIYFVLMREAGIYACSVDYSTDLASVDYYPRHISEGKIFRLISQLGYRPTNLRDSRQSGVGKALYLRFVIAAFCSLNIMMFSYPLYASYFHSGATEFATLFAWLSCLGSLPVLTYSAWPVWRRFYFASRAGIWGMETLVFIGVFAAFTLSGYELLKGSHYVYFDTMTVVILFVLLGKIIESKAKFSAKDSLLRLAKGVPRRGRKRFEDGSERFVPVKEINLSDTMIVLTGERVVLDGVVEEGNGTCDESLMTGESLPLMKNQGDLVLAGSILTQGHLIVRVTAGAEETALHQIIGAIEQGIGRKSESVRFIDLIVKRFVPVVLSLASLTACYCLFTGTADPGHTVVQTAFIRAISVILISCPCAVGIAVPLAESHILNAFAKRGAIVRNRGCLSYLGRETSFIFDKTGTVTEGKFTVLEGVNSLTGEDQARLKGLVSYSNHPIAIALNQFLFCSPEKPKFLEEIAGKGMRGTYDLEDYLLGSENFMRERGVVLPIILPSLISCHTVVFFARGRCCLSSILLGDRVKQGVAETLQALRPVKTWLISGDSPFTVEAVAKVCGFDNWVGECLPLQKRDRVTSLKDNGEIVAMLGDGINDAPALTAAHIGIAVMTATDISVQVSDILFTKDCLSVLPELRRLAVKGHQILRQNLFWAFFYNVVGIVLAMAGLLSPIFAAFAMTASSLIVLFNAQRISR